MGAPVNRRGFFRGVLACAMTAAARVYTPSALSPSKAMPVQSDFVWLTIYGAAVSPSQGMPIGYKTYIAPENVPPFPPLRGQVVQPAEYVCLPYVPHARPR